MSAGSIRFKRVIGSPNCQKDYSETYGHEQRRSVIERRFRKEPDDSYEEEHEKDVGNFPYWGQIALNDFRKDALLSGYQAVSIEESCTEVDGSDHNVAKQKCPQHGDSEYLKVHRTSRPFNA